MITEIGDIMTGRQENNLKYLVLIENTVKDESQCVKGFVNYLSSMAIKTRYNYVKKVIKFLKETKKNESDLEYVDFLSYISNIQYKENGEEITPSYRMTIYSALKKFCKFLFVSKVIPENYMENIDKPQTRELQRTVIKRRKAFMTEEELKEYIYNVNNGITMNEHSPCGRWRNRDKAIINLFLTTGIRCSALINLDVNDIDFKSKTLYVTDKGSRVSSYHMTEDTASILGKWINDRSKMSIDGQALFITKYRRRMTIDSISGITKKYAMTLDEKNISPHKLRVAYARMLYSKTNDLFFVQKCMGHKSPRTTELYLGECLNEKERIEASEIISDML